MKQAPIGAVVREAAEPHANRGKQLHYDIGGGAGALSEQPIIMRRPEIIHGLRNLVQNAVDFACEHVWIDILWDESHVKVRIIDDGSGFSSNVMNRLGDPFVGRKARAGNRPGYEGMGLGLFIAKTLLERSGADVSFANGRTPFEPKPEPGERAGAVVEARWRREGLGETNQAGRAALGANVPIEA